MFKFDLVAMLLCEVFSVFNMNIANHSHLTPCSGQILASLHFPAERKTAADILAQCVTDKQNYRTHLMPYLALESSDIRAYVATAVARS